MNCLYITLFFNIIAGIVQTFIKFWKQLLYFRVIEVCRLLFELRHDFFLQPHQRLRTFSQRDVPLGEETSGNRWGRGEFHEFPLDVHFCFEKSYDVTHLAFGGTLDRHCHFKHVSLKQSRFYQCQTSTFHR